MDTQLRAIAMTLVTLGLLALGGCGCNGYPCVQRTTSDIRIEDQVVLPSLRVAMDFTGRAPDGPSSPHTAHAIEAAISGSQGSAEQTLPAGQQPVVFGGQTFNAPQAIHYDFSFRDAEVLYRYRHLFGRQRRIGVEGVAGLGYLGVDLRASSASQSARDKLNTLVVPVGGGVIWKLWPTTSVQARYMYFQSFSDYDGVTNAQRFDIHLAQAIGRYAGVRLGYADWTVTSLREKRGEGAPATSPIELRMRGPTAGLEVMF